MEAKKSLIFLPELDLAEAEQGDKEAQYRVGLYNREQKNYTEAVKWLQKAGNQNHAESLYTLAMMYETGEGIAQNTTEALKLYRKVAEQGYPEAKDKMMALYQLIKTNCSLTQQQAPVLLNKQVILSRPIVPMNNIIVKSPTIIYEKHVEEVEKTTPDVSSEDSDSEDSKYSPSTYNNPSTQILSTRTTYDPNAWTRSQLKSSMQTSNWHRKMNNF